MYITRNQFLIKNNLFYIFTIIQMSTIIYKFYSASSYCIWHKMKQTIEFKPRKFADKCHRVSYIMYWYVCFWPKSSTELLPLMFKLCDMNIPDQDILPFFMKKKTQKKQWFYLNTSKDKVKNIFFIDKYNIRILDRHSSVGI